MATQGQENASDPTKVPHQRVILGITFFPMFLPLSPSMPTQGFKIDNKALLVVGKLRGLMPEPVTGEVRAASAATMAQQEYYRAEAAFANQSAQHTTYIREWISVEIGERALDREAERNRFWSEENGVPVSNNASRYRLAWTRASLSLRKSRIGLKKTAKELGPEWQQTCLRFLRAGQLLSQEGIPQHVQPRFDFWKPAIKAMEDMDQLQTVEAAEALVALADHQT